MARFMLVLRVFHQLYHDPNSAAYLSASQTIVIIMSLSFVGFVTILHIIGKVGICGVPTER